MMDHGSLQDLGISSIGHRLNLLRAVWELKKEQGISMGDDDWKPQGGWCAYLERPTLHRQII